MGFINGMFGNASTVSKASAEAELASILIEGESVDAAFKLVRDLIVLRRNA